MCIYVFSRSVVSNTVTPWTAACQASLTMRFSRQEYWSGLPCPSSGDLPNPGINPGSTELQADALPSELPGKPLSLLKYYQKIIIFNKWCYIKKNGQFHVKE